jgi:protein phosphatase
MSGHERNWDDRLECAALSDIGMRRSSNQDAHCILLAKDRDAWQQRGHFFMVADGMGAHAAGELASKLAVDGVAHLYQKYTELSPPEALEKAIVETNGEVHRRGQANSDFRNMGTTASVLVLLPHGALVAHIGDSRVYRLRNHAIQQLTFDHSLVWELKKAGQFSDQSDLAQAIPKNVITRSLGPNASVQVDIEGPFPTLAEDVYLLCSDGLTGKLEDREVAAIVAQLPAEDAAQLLIDLANLRGGPDNITVLVARIAGGELASEAPAQRPQHVRKGQRSLHSEPLLWVAVAVLLLIALVLSIVDRPVAALLAGGLAAVVCLAAALMKRWSGLSGIALNRGRRLGRGPYTETACPTADDAANLLQRLTREVRQQGSEGGLSIDWASFDAACRQADEARRAGNLRAAIRWHAKAVRALMVELRSQERAQASDSALEL